MPLAQVGLALATAIGAWINLGLVVWFAVQQNLFSVDREFARSIGRIALAGAVMGLVLWLVAGPAAGLLGTGSLRDEIALALLAAIGAVVYGGTVFVLFGPQWLNAFRHRRRSDRIPKSSRDE